MMSSFSRPTPTSEGAVTARAACLERPHHTFRQHAFSAGHSHRRHTLCNQVANDGAHYTQTTAFGEALIAPLSASPQGSIAS